MEGSDTSREYLLIVIGISVPIFLRFMQATASRFVCKSAKRRCFNNSDPCSLECIFPKKLSLEDYIRDGALLLSEKEAAARDKIIAWVEQNPGALPSDCSSLDWCTMRMAFNWTWQMALSVGILRLVFWHWFQPIFYCWALYSYSEQIDRLQIVFGLVVAAREILYFLQTLLALYFIPVFLLVNIGSTYICKESMMRFVIQTTMYVLAPEKFVSVHLYESMKDVIYKWENGIDYFHARIQPIFWFLWLYNLIGDLAALIALIIGLARNDLPVPLAINYSLTALAACWSVFWILFPCFTGVNCFSGERRVKYTGERNAEGKYHGHGTLYDYNFTVYTGEFRNGEKHGTGILTFHTGTVH